MSFNLKLIKELEKQGYKNIIGLDEAGRGPLAGPVVAAAVLFKRQPSMYLLREVRDSKELSAKRREQLYQILRQDFLWARGLVGPRVIDRINILQATKLAMRRAVNNLENRIGKSFLKTKTALIIDGNQGINSQFQEFTAIKGDRYIFLCSAASIIAKVERDNLMVKYHQKFSEYNFPKHKGYPTKKHKELIKRYGLSSLHRKTFQC